MRSKTVWNDDYKGVSYEIQNFKLGDKNAWTFYLYIPLDAIPEDRRERFWLTPEITENSKRISYSYYDEPLIADIEWHCGCTWYSKHGMDGSPRVIQIGCDYQHYWDEGHFYNVDIVAMDARRAIDSFLEMVPDLMKRCSWDGRYVPESEGQYHGELFYSNEGWRLSEKWHEEWKAKQAIAKAEAHHE